MESFSSGKKEMIRKLMSPEGKTRELALSVELDPVRYEWRQINCMNFLYDRRDDLHIPEEVYLDLLAGALGKATSE
jgi:hypothetical protein